MTTFDINAIGSRFCMYLRKSREDLLAEAITNHDTLALHRQQLTEFAQRLRAPITEIYEEIGSAESIPDRPVFAQLLDEIERGIWDGVFVIEIERLCRGSAREQGQVGEAFVDSGTYIFTPQKIYDPSSESDMEYFDFSLFMSRREYLTIRRRLQNGKLNHCRRGEYIGKEAPFGYDKIKAEGMKTLKPNEQARYVKMMYEWYADGDSILTIAQRLTALSVPTLKPSARGQIWSKATVRGILKNPIYIGKIRWMNRIYKIEKVDGKKIKKTVFNESPHLFPGLHHPIVSQELWDAVQARMADLSSPYPRDRTPRNYYSGLIRCGECGATLTYQCKPGRQPAMVHRSWADCQMKSCKLSNIDELLIDWLTSTVEDLELEIEDAQLDRQRARYDLERERLLSDIAKARKTISDNIERLEDGIYTKEQFLERQAIHNERIANAEASLAALPEPSMEAQLALTTTIHATIESLRDPDFDATAKNELLKSIIKEIRYYNYSPVGSDSELTLEVYLRR